LFAIDAKWWERYLPEVRADFPGALFSTNDFPGQRITRLNKPYRAFGNSGAGAIALAVKAGASRVILLGYDCQKTGGQVHHHGDHPQGLGNAGSMPQWPEKFARLAASLPEGVEVINCSRETALTAFPRGELESALCP
jgi:hypothetical protein